jgi:hypothetical protein
MWGTPLFGGIVFDRFWGQNDKVKSHFRPKCIYVLCALAMLIGASTDMRSITYHPDVKMQEAVLISAKLVLTEKRVPKDKQCSGLYWLPINPTAPASITNTIVKHLGRSNSLLSMKNPLLILLKEKHYK